MNAIIPINNINDSTVALAVRTTCPVLGVPIDAISKRDVAAKIIAWAAGRESRVVCICNVHSVMTARREPDFGAVLERSDINTPDGMPLAWSLRAKGFRGQERVTGPDLMPVLNRQAAANGISVYLYGSTPEVLSSLEQKMLRDYPRLTIAGKMAPPFRQLTTEEERSIAGAINASGAGIVWVGLGCPKQELWMHRQAGHINAVMIGVGAGFDYQIGRIRRAPQWMQTCGLEWLYRLGQEPRRLFRRYLTTNAAFLLLSAGEVLKKPFAGR